MKVDLGIWAKLTSVVIVLIFIAVFLFACVWYSPLIRQNQRMRQYIVGLDAQIQKQEEAGKQLRASIDALKNDPKTVERLARERLGYAKAGETVIRFEEPQTNSLPRH
jgi:cell division protein FtsB